MTADNRSVSIGGNAVGSTIVTGDQNTVVSNVMLPPANSVDIHQELAALRQLLTDAAWLGRQATPWLIALGA